MATGDKLCINTFKLFSAFVFSILILSSCNDSRINNRKDSNIKATYFLRSCLRAIQINDGFNYCDTILDKEMNCIINFDNKKYLKREKVYFDSIGNIQQMIFYKPEGLIRYQKAELLADSLLLSESGWSALNNSIKIGGDSIFYPIIGKIKKIDLQNKQIFCLYEPNKNGKRILMQFSYW